MKRIFSLGLVFVMVLSLFAMSFGATSNQRVINREIGGATTKSAPIRIIEW